MNATQVFSQRWLWLSILLLLLGSTSAHADAEEPAAEDEIQALFEQGLVALAADRLKTARGAFEEVLRRNPNLQRARVELAVAHFRSLNYAEARRLGEQVLKAPETPPEVRSTVLSFLAQVKLEQAQFAVRHHTEPSIDAAFLYDSNVNVGPTDIVEFGGVPLELAPGAAERSDAALVVDPGFEHSFQPGKTYQVGQNTAYLLWQSRAHLYHRQYFDETDFNLTVLSAHTGPAWIAPRHWRAHLRMQADYIWLGGEELALFGSLTPSVSWDLPVGLELTVDGVVTDRDYASSMDEPREGLYSAVGVSMGHYFSGGRVAFQAGARYADFDAKSARFSHYGTEVWGGADITAWDNGTVYLRAAYRTLDFRGPEPPPFGIMRDDEELRYLLGFEHRFTAGPLTDWRLSGSWLRTDNESNVPIFEYDRDQLNLTVSRSF